MKKYCLLCMLFILRFGYSQSLPQVESLIQKEINKSKIPALAVSVIDSGKIVHLSAHGFRDLESKKKAHIHTPFHIASVSKTVITLAIFKLVETKAIDLEADINKYLPFKVQNPHFPDDKITVRELLNHRSGIRDNYELYEPHWLTPKGDPKEKLVHFLEDYLTPKGKLYHPKHFAKEDNYKKFAYSNTGYALLGLIIETVSGLDLEKFSQEYIFQPMGMKNSSWFLKHLNLGEVAKTYTYSDSTGYHFKGYNGYPDYPAGQLRTSISDFSKLTAAYLNASNSNFILQISTTKKITPSPVIAHNGFYTWYLTTVNDRLYYSHEGGDLGVKTVVLMDVKKRRAIIIFINSEVRLGQLWRAIEKASFAR